MTDSAGGVITSNAAILGVTSYVFIFDGLSQYVSLASNITIPASAEFEIEFYGRFIGDLYNPMFSSSDAATFARALPIAQGVGIQSTFGGVSFNTTENLNNTGVRKLNFVYKGGVGKWFYDDAQKSIRTVATTSPIIISQLLKFGSSSSVSSGRFYGLKIWSGGDKSTGTLILNLPINNRPAGSMQPSTVGPSGNIVNYNAAGWESV